MEGMALLILYTNSSLPLYLSPWSSCGERQLTCSAGADHPPGSGPGSDPSSLQCSKIISSWIFINYLRHSLNSQDAKVITVWHLFWSRACFQMQVRRLTLSNSHNWIYSFYLILFNTHTHKHREWAREKDINLPPASLHPKCTHQSGQGLAETMSLDFHPHMWGKCLSTYATICSLPVCINMKSDQKHSSWVCNWDSDIKHGSLE